MVAFSCVYRNLGIFECNVTVIISTVIGINYINSEYLLLYLKDIQQHQRVKSVRKSAYSLLNQEEWISRASSKSSICKKPFCTFHVPEKY